MAPLCSRWEIPPDPQEIGGVRRAVARFAAQAGVADGALTDVQVAVSDAVTNVILHANSDRDGVRVRVAAEEVGDELVVRVCDGGETAERPIYPVLGPRLSMIAALAQAFVVRRCDGGSTELRMHFALGRG